MRGLDYSGVLTLDTLLELYATIGFQAMNLYRAIKEVHCMVTADVKVFFRCTFNIISSGLCEHVRYMVQHSHFNVMVCIEGELIVSQAHIYC